MNKILSEKKIFLNIDKKWLSNPIWFHVSSGEFEYAKHIIRLIKAKNPEQPVIVSYFSISYKKAIESFPGVDGAFMLPWDFSFPIKHLISQIQPQSLIIVRTDIWPELIYQAQKQKIPVHFIAARKSKYVFNQLYLNNLSTISCIHQNDLDFFKSLNLSAKIELIGDPRYDQVFDRLEQSLLKPIQKSTEALYFIGGSLWPEDEIILFKMIAKNKKLFKWILVPHEVNDEHIQSLIDFCEIENLSWSLFSKSQNLLSDVTIIDVFGVLAELYQISDVAFIGGSFKKQVHSVMEALCCGCITIVGPYYKNNSEALEFKEVILGHDIRAVNVVTSEVEIEKLSHVVKNLELKKIKNSLISYCKNKKGASKKLLNIISPP